jgi:hypothetical protein
MKPSKEQIEAGAIAIMNERLAQKGVPPLTNLDKLYPQVLLEVTADSEAALRAVIVPELQRCERLAAINADLLAALKTVLAGIRGKVIEDAILIDLSATGPSAPMQHLSEIVCAAIAKAEAR